MATINENGQTCLEINAIEERQKEIARNDYNSEEGHFYYAGHRDAKSDGDPQGKGVGSSHGFSLPDCSKPKNMIDYSNFQMENVGGQYDLEGRGPHPGYNQQMAKSLYNKNYQYGANLVKTKENVAQGQYQFGETLKK